MSEISKTLTRTGVTQVDLGDDLLQEPTGISTLSSRQTEQSDLLERDHPVISTRLSSSEDIHDQLESARILMGEGLLDEAKRILRKVVLADPHQVLARKRLDEIHEIELKQIFGQSRPPRRTHRDVEQEEDLNSIDSEAIMRRLDEDLRLGIFDHERNGESQAAELSLFQDRVQMEKFAHELDRELAGSTARDRMDIGIAFLEMGLYDLAIRQFNIASRDTVELLPATALLSQALILAGRPFEATLRLGPILEDSEILPHTKIDFLYLMARACEGLKKTESAAQWYQQLLQTDPHYRDAEERMERITERHSGRTSNGRPR